MELPQRCVQLYSYTEEVVLDPFMGSGSTAVAASMAQRHFVGYEIQESYCQAAERQAGRGAAFTGPGRRPGWCNRVGGERGQSRERFNYLRPLWLGEPPRQSPHL